MNNQYLPGVIQIPSALEITAITQSFPMVVSVDINNSSTEANTYIVGQAVKLNVPYVYGMFQANNLVSNITAINGTDFSLNIDSRDFDPFVVPTGTPYGPATISPNGSRNLTYNNQTGIVPFQSLNNIGN